MNLKRFVIEMGTGIDQHGQDVTKAAVRAVEDAVRRICLAGLEEIVGVSSGQEVVIDVLIACPNPQAVKTDDVLKALPFGKRQIRVVEGGMLAPVTFEPRIGDRTAEAVVANAAITVSVDMDKILETWKRV
ncbi:MAG: Lin0512 family protein [Chloroflexi bacterium]|nr:Lin0512 family protein [Chloroflexota bacterium]